MWKRGLGIQPMTDKFYGLYPQRRADRQQQLNRDERIPALERKTPR